MSCRTRMPGLALAATLATAGACGDEAAPAADADTDGACADPSRPAPSPPGLYTGPEAFDHSACVPGAMAGIDPSGLWIGRLPTQTAGLHRQRPRLTIPHESSVGGLSTRDRTQR